MQQRSVGDWLLFTILAFIWGSSFILMKEGLHELTAYQVAAIRMLSAGLVLLPFSLRNVGSLSRKQLLFIVLSGVLGSFIPAILFCVAETRIDSALAGMLNALTPLFVIGVGALFFSVKTKWHKVAGVVTGFAGMVLLFLSQLQQSSGTHLFYASLVALATACYGLNVNLVNRYLHQTASLQIAAVSFTVLLLPSLLVLQLDGFFRLPLTRARIWSIGAASVLGVLGTALATILFYRLMKRAGPLFSSMVTYGIPFVALFWGIVAGETVTLLQLTGLLVILGGVYLANRQ